MLKRATIMAAGTAALSYVTYKYYQNSKIGEEKIYKSHVNHLISSLAWKPKPRKQIINDLKNQNFDLLIIGGGASGAGCVLDAASRGLNVALVEAGDFACETSSKSTKLLHGGVRYLEKVFKSLDYEQLKLVKEALDERKNIINISPYLTRVLPIMLPVYDYFSIPYFLAGLKIYDWISGSQSLGKSFYSNTANVVKSFPYIKREGLKGGIIYFDAQQNDARNNLMLAITASYYGATVSNYVEVKDLIKEEDIIIGARCKDKISGEEFEVKAKGVLNTTGPFTDNMRFKGLEKEKIMVQSSGTHIVLPKEYAPSDIGLINPYTTDNRVLFSIPWRGKSIVGTTDNMCELKKDISPTKQEIDFIVENLKKSIKKQTEPISQKILSAFTGIRPLVKDINSKDTESIARNHCIYLGKDNLLTLTGGKWTTYRRMAEEAIDKAIEVFNLTPKRGCITKNLKILGGDGYNKHSMDFISKELNVSRSIAKHLTDSYGTFAIKLRQYSKNGELNKLTPNYCFLKEEVEYAIDNEMAIKPHDILGRRMGLGFLDVKEAAKAVDDVCEIMKNKLGWSKNQEKNEKNETYKYLKTLGLGLI